MSTTDMLAYPRSYQSDSSSGEGAKLARRDSEQFLSYYQSPLADEGPSYGRPSSPDKGSTRVQLRRKSSGGSTSSSDYSSASISEQSEKETRSKSSPTFRRRSTEGGAARRRLAIVKMDSLYEHKSIPKSSSDSGVHSNNLRSRRGLETRRGGLALVAPPDAAPRTYTYLPPSTAPIAGGEMGQDILVNDSDGGRHCRSASETVGSSKKGAKSPRDVGIVGTSPTTERPKQTQPYTGNRALRPPIFQMPKSRSPSPGGVSDYSDSSHFQLFPENTRPLMKKSSTDQTIIIPEIGQEKAKHVPIVAPVVKSLDTLNLPQVGISSFEPTSPAPQIVVEPMPSAPLAHTKPLSYLHYQPGIHATAGPLPPPPRAIFTVDTNSPPPPRPPRLHSPPPRPRGDMGSVQQALQLPTSVSTVLVSTSPTVSVTDASSNSNGSSQSVIDPEAESLNSNSSKYSSQVHSPNHTREGAFAPSRIIPSGPGTPSDSDAKTQISPSSQPAGPMDDLVADVDNAIDDVGFMNASDVPPLTTIHPPPRMESSRPGLEFRRDDNCPGISPDPIPSPDEARRTSADFSPRTASRSRSPPYINWEYTGRTPSPPPKSFRHTVTANLKRFSSLPRTPSYKSYGGSSSNGQASRTPSVSSLPPLPPPRRKIISQSPSAMFYMDVIAKKTTMERCIGYAQKINELYIYDCGLSDWVMDAQSKGPSTNGLTRRTTLMPSAPSTQVHTPQPRHASRTSMMSEVTFPRRPDASTATDLSVRAKGDITPPTAPPALPYPSLAQQPSRSSSTVASGTPPSSMRMLAPTTQALKATGFFASLGRKASLKKDKPGPTSNVSSPSAGKLLTKSPSSPRPINIPNNPSVPGGPRAPPNRRLRSQTIMISSPFSSNSPTLDRHSSLARAPSALALSPEPALDVRADPEFVRQVDKLAHLLPQADREVLSGYLRRAGQDILAIGQYLEDEKNGTIRRD